MNKISSRNNLIFLLFWCCSGFSSVQNQSEISAIFSKIENQIQTLETIVEHSSNNQISTHYYSKIIESKVFLSQVKAQNKVHYNKDKLNALYSSIVEILKLKKNDINKNISKKANQKALISNGIIRGIVRDFETQLVISNSLVRIYNSTGDLIDEKHSDNIGRYIFQSLPAGEYTITASSFSLNYITTAQPNIPCPGGLGFGCQIEELSLIVLEESEILGNIDIILKVAPIILGEVHDAQDPSLKIGSAKIELYNSEGVYIDEVFSQSFGQNQGKFKISTPNEGDYFITVRHSEYQTQLYNNINCESSCDFNLGTLVQLSIGQQLNGFDFKMNKSYSISGTLIDSITSLPSNGGNIAILNLEGETVSTTSVDSDGFWIEEHLPMGEYKITSYSSEGYLASVYDQLNCKTQYGGCADVFSSGITVFHSNSNTEGLIIKHALGASIAGRVTDTLGNPISGARIYLFDTALQRISNYRTYTDTNGDFETYAVNNGSYYLIAHANNFQGELYPNVYCHDWLCDYNSGSLVTINNLSKVDNIDFQLNGFAHISGKLTTNNVPISNKYVVVRSTSNSYVNSFHTNSQGEYLSTNLTAGDYEVYVSTFGFYPEIYNNVRCDDEDCLDEAVAPLTITDNQLINIDFDLDAFEQVVFNFTSTTANPVDTGQIYVYTSQGEFFKSFNISSNILLPVGSYYFSYTSNVFVPKVYGGENCFDDCDPFTGNLVDISSNSNVTLNMNLDEYFQLDFISTIGSASYYLYNTNFSAFWNSYAENDTKHINSNSAKLLKLSKYNYYSKIYNSIDCYSNDCDLTQATVITPLLNSSLAINLDEMLPIDGTISGVISNSLGLAVDNLRVELYTDLSSNYSNIYTYTDINGEYLFSNKVAGEYYIKVVPNSSSQLAMTYYGNIACHINCNEMIIPATILNIGENLSDIDIQIINKGYLSGEGILDVTLQPIESTIYVFEEGELDSENYVKFSDINQDGTLSSLFLEPGSYKIVIAAQVHVYSSYLGQTCEYLSLAECAQESQTIIIVGGEDYHLSQYTVHKYGEIKGLITDSVSGNPINDTNISVYKVSDGSFFKIIDNFLDGEFSIKIERGEYYLITNSYFNRFHDYNRNYIPKLYDNIDCTRGLGIDCSLASGQFVTVEDDNIIEIDIGLNAKPKLTISLINTFSGEKIDPWDIRVLNLEGEVIARNGGRDTWIDNSTQITTLNPNEPYIIEYGQNNLGYMGAIYPGVFCQTETPFLCEQQTTETVTLLPSVDREINLKTVLLEGINGYVKNQYTDQGIENVFIDLWNNFGEYISSTKTSSYGGFSIAADTGEYFISTDVRETYENEVYNDFQCEKAAILGECDLSQGDLVSLPVSNIEPVAIDIKLGYELLFVNGFEEL